MERQTLRDEEGNKFDFDGIDRTIGEEFEDKEDLRSYFASKFGERTARILLETVDQ